jgi:hypothetical protein
MKYAVEMGSGAMIFIKTGSVIQKLIGGDSQTYKQHVDLTTLF